MAAITPATVQKVSLGSNNLVIATFTTASDTDTWTSGITNVASFWTQTNGNPVTQTSAGSAATNAAGVFTFYPGENSLGVILFVIYE